MSWGTNSWNCAARSTRTGMGPASMAFSWACFAAPCPAVKWSMPRTDTSTIRCTPAIWPISCRLRAEAVKNALAASGVRRCRPLAVPLAASMTHSAPVNASAKPSPATTSTPVDRDIGTTSWPLASSSSTTRLPTLPVAPATAILIDAGIGCLLVLCVPEGATTKASTSPWRRRTREPT